MISVLLSTVRCTKTRCVTKPVKFNVGHFVLVFSLEDTIFPIVINLLLCHPDLQITCYVLFLLMSVMAHSSAY